MNIKVAKIIVFIIGCIPLIGVTVSLFADPTPDPYERLAHTTGEFSLRFLFITLLITPVRNIFSWKRIGAFRRTFGVLTFTYVLAHFISYFIFEAELNFSFIGGDIADRRFILVGVLSATVIFFLGITSNNFSVGKLGRNWKRLHYLVYPACLLACLHFLQQVKGDEITEPIIYFVLFSILLIYRIVNKVIKTRVANSTVPTN